MILNCSAGISYGSATKRQIVVVKINDGTANLASSLTTVFPGQSEPSVSGLLLILANSVIRQADISYYIFGKSSKIISQCLSFENVWNGLVTSSSGLLVRKIRRRTGLISLAPSNSFSILDISPSLLHSSNALITRMTIEASSIYSDNGALMR
jgi:hypothetical protein